VLFEGEFVPLIDGSVDENGPTADRALNCLTEGGQFGEKLRKVAREAGSPPHSE
jgi:hypothetical protein